jgi:hypothetical protein
MSNGYLPKSIASSHLACRECAQFRDDDPDLYYCELNNKHFPGLCASYECRSQYPDERQRMMQEHNDLL